MSEIQKFYHNSTILITGGTGFLGKLLVEKLLRSCQSINQIYLIMRNKNGVSVSERMEKYFEDPVFTRVKQENLHYLSQVTVISGDMECDNLNLSPENIDLLINNVNVIIHAAANVNFKDNIRNSVDINLHAIRRIIKLGKRMPNIKSIVHISTAYSNCHLSQIDEKIYPGPKTYDEIFDLLRIYNDEELEKITPMLRGKSPNNYTFTKALAEQYIAKNCGDLPMGIFRPAIIISTANEPIEGWIDNFYGPTGLITSAALGLLHVAHADTDTFANMVPADMVVNAILASAWEIAEKRKELPIYNYVSTQNPISWGQYAESVQLGFNYPFSKSIWYYSVTLIRQKWLYDILKVCFHLLPAFVFDIVLKMLNKKPKFVSSYNKIHKLSDVLSYFTINDIAFQNDNVTDLWDKLTPKDKELFNFNMKTLDWTDYYKHYIKGIRQFLLKDDFANLPTARARYQKLYWIHQFSKISAICVLFYSICRVFQY